MTSGNPQLKLHKNFWLIFTGMASSLTQPSLGYLVVRPATLQVDALRLGQFFRTNDDILYVKSAEGERWVIGDDLLIKASDLSYHSPCTFLRDAYIRLFYIFIGQVHRY